ncbi:MAG: S-methyl-5-thioribose-1-phosphate isomerase [Aeropyrum sp.]|nr:S-methyl-5-thioribose-1-phosphate isomerase [Aeropyrum sp.]
MGVVGGGVLREIEALEPYLRVKPLYFDFDSMEFVWLDTRLIPFREEYRRSSDYRRIARAIVDMEIRGAPAIGVSASYALALAALEASGAGGEFMDRVSEARRVLESTRPTAYNLFWALARVYRAVEEGFEAGGVDRAVRAGFEEAARIYVEDVRGNVEIGRIGSSLIEDGDTILTHCNTGALATAGFGTALGVIRYAWMEGKSVSVVTTETRPVLQGARLNVWELRKEGIPFKLIVDSAAGLVLARGIARKVIVGADRIVGTGHTANKIGTLQVALAAKNAGKPFYVAAPISTFQPAAGPGDIVIEERGGDEVRTVFSESGVVRITLEGVDVYNPSFDVTPPDLISSFITERGIIEPPYMENIRRVVGGAPG